MNYILLTKLAPTYAGNSTILLNFVVANYFGKHMDFLYSNSAAALTAEIFARRTQGFIYPWKFTDMVAGDLVIQDHRLRWYWNSLAWIFQSQHQKGFIDCGLDRMQLLYISTTCIGVITVANWTIKYCALYCDISYKYRYIKANTDFGLSIFDVLNDINDSVLSHSFTKQAQAYPFPNFHGCNGWEWISNFFPHFTGHVITYPCWD